MSTATEPTETLKQWAVRVAHTLDADGWEDAERAARDDGEYVQVLWPAWSPHRVVLMPSQARALLAYRDKVAEGLDAEERYGVIDSTDDDGADGNGLERCGELGLVMFDFDNFAYATSFGREIARILTQGDIDR